MGGMSHPTILLAWLSRAETWLRLYAQVNASESLRLKNGPGATRHAQMVPFTLRLRTMRIQSRDGCLLFPIHSSSSHGAGRPLTKESRAWKKVICWWHGLSMVSTFGVRSVALVWLPH